MQTKKTGHLERKQEILTTAIDLFGEKGFSRTPTSLIARKAGVAEGLIFHYFKNKKGILVNILDAIIDAYLCGLDALDHNALSGLETIEQFILFHFKLRESQSKAFLVLNRELASDIIAPGSEEHQFLMDKWNRVLDFYKQALRKGRKDGSIRDISIDETALVIRGLLMGVNTLYREFLNIPNISAIPGEVINFIHRSLSPDAKSNYGDDK